MFDLRDDEVDLLLAHGRVAIGLFQILYRLHVLEGRLHDVEIVTARRHLRERFPLFVENRLCPVRIFDGVVIFGNERVDVPVDPHLLPLFDGDPERGAQPVRLHHVAAHAVEHRHARLRQLLEHVERMPPKSIGSSSVGL